MSRDVALIWKPVRLFSAVGAFALSLLSTALAASPAPEPLAVITSYSTVVYEPVRTAFEARHPGVRLKFSNRKTSAAVAAIINPAREPVDVFWASSPDAFEALRKAGRLARLPAAYPRDWRIGGLPVDDPSGFYAGFAISGFGFVWSEVALARAGAPSPDAIAALTDPAYRGLLAMTTPSRSGTTHLMVETVLQDQGWTEGWATWSAVAGNLATITARSYSVAAGVAQGRFGIGLSIDFIGRAQESGLLRFAYPADGVFLPASVGIVAGTKKRAAAEAFVAFLMSAEGQAILRNPAVGRSPVDPAAHAALPDDLYARAARRASRPFDAGLSGGRYELVNLLFDEAITLRLPALQAQWARVRAAERQPETRERAREAGRLLGAVPIDDAESRDEGILARSRSRDMGRDAFASSGGARAILAGGARSQSRARDADPGRHRGREMTAHVVSRSWRFGIAWRLSAAFVGVGGLAVAACFVGWLSYARLAADLETISRVHLPAASMSAALGEQGGAIIATAPVLALARSGAEYATAKGWLDDRLAAMRDVVGRLRGADGAPKTEDVEAIAANLSAIDAVVRTRLLLESRNKRMIAELRWLQADLMDEGEPLIEESRYIVRRSLDVLSGGEAPQADEAARLDAELKRLDTIAQLNAQANLAVGLMNRIAALASREDLSQTMQFLAETMDVVESLLLAIPSGGETATLRQALDRLIQLSNVDDGIPGVRRAEIGAADEARTLLSTNRQLVERLNGAIAAYVRAAGDGAASAAAQSAAAIRLGRNLLLGVAALSMFAATGVGVF